MANGSGAAGVAPPLDDRELDAIVEALVEARASRRPFALPPDFARRCTPAQASRIAMLHTQRVLAMHGGRVLGHKLGGTNRAALDRLGLERPFVGPVFSAFTHPSPAALPRDGFLLCVLETEVAVRLGRPLDGRAAAPSRQAVIDAIDALFPVIEIADSRLAGFPAVPPVAITADLGFGAALVTGAECLDWRRHDLAALTVALGVNGTVVQRGSGSAVLGHPLDAIVEYVADAAGRGEVVPAAEVISTGTWTQPHMAGKGDHVVADFGPLGKVELTLA